MQIIKKVDYIVGQIYEKVRLVLPVIGCLDMHSQSGY